MGNKILHTCLCMCWLAQWADLLQWQQRDMPVFISCLLQVNMPVKFHCLPSRGPYSLPICTSKGTEVSEAVRFRMAVTVKQTFKHMLLHSTNFLDNPKSCTLCGELEELLLACESPPQPYSPSSKPMPTRNMNITLCVAKVLLSFWI